MLAKLHDDSNAWPVNGVRAALGNTALVQQQPSAESACILGVQDTIARAHVVHALRLDPPTVERDAASSKSIAQSLSGARDLPLVRPWQATNTLWWVVVL